MKKLIIGILVFLGAFSALAGITHNNEPLVLLTCLPSSEGYGVKNIQLELLGNNYHTRILFEDQKQETFSSKEILATGSWFRVVNARASRDSDRVKSFDIMSPRLERDYGLIVLKTNDITKEVMVICSK